MSKARWPSLVVIMIGLLSIAVDGQPTVDDGSSCEATTQDEAVINLIARGFSDMKKLFGSRQQTCTAVDSSSLCEYKTYSTDALFYFIMLSSFYILSFCCVLLCCLVACA